MDNETPLPGRMKRLSMNGAFCRLESLVTFRDGILRLGKQKSI
jgi:hypothetical protein